LPNGNLKFLLITNVFVSKSIDKKNVKFPTPYGEMDEKKKRRRRRSGRSMRRRRKRRKKKRRS